ncbi:hypothetical protein AAIB33_07395 [Microbacterium sp. AZCO]|uniref:hypothetical protein n=1 Tax=Microbacterium sp. AZCO TaxID=3142976 RepID=UPI0031F43DFD
MTDSPSHTTVHTQLSINDGMFLLAQVQDVEDLKRRIEKAAASPARFVDFIVVGNRTVSVLVSVSTRVVISVETAPFDPRDDGDIETSFGGEFDL